MRAGDDMKTTVFGSPLGFPWLGRGLPCKSLKWLAFAALFLTSTAIMTQSTASRVTDTRLQELPLAGLFDFDGKPFQTELLQGKWTFLCLGDAPCKIEDGFAPDGLAHVAARVLQSGDSFRPARAAQVLVVSSAGQPAWSRPLVVSGVRVIPLYANAEETFRLQAALSASGTSARGVAVIDPFGRHYAGVDVADSPMAVGEILKSLVQDFDGKMMAHLL